MIILETYTTKEGSLDLPSFLTVVCEVTGDRRYSMHTLSTLSRHDVRADNTS